MWKKKFIQSFIKVKWAFIHPIFFYFFLTFVCQSVCLCVCVVMFPYWFLFFFLLFWFFFHIYRKKNKLLSILSMKPVYLFRLLFSYHYFSLKKKSIETIINMHTCVCVCGSAIGLSFVCISWFVHEWMNESNLTNFFLICFVYSNSWRVQCVRVRLFVCVYCSINSPFFSLVIVDENVSNRLWSMSNDQYIHTHTICLNIVILNKQTNKKKCQANWKTKNRNQSPSYL